MQHQHRRKRGQARREKDALPGWLVYYAPYPWVTDYMRLCRRLSEAYRCSR